MSAIEAATDIEQTVGAYRDRILHIGRVVTGERKVYILHPTECVQSHEDLRSCAMSLAMDEGIELADWRDATDRPMVLGVSDRGKLVPADKSSVWVWSRAVTVQHILDMLAKGAAA